MKKYILCRSKKLVVISFVLLSTAGYSQNDHLTNPDLLQPQLVSNGPGGTLYIASSGVNPNPVFNIKGNQYFIADWVKGIVLFKDGKRYDNGELQFDWTKNELHFKNDGKTNRFAQPIQEFLLFDTALNSSGAADFRNGYPKFGAQTTNSFYQVISTGNKFQLLKYWSKHEKEAYEYGGPTMISYTKVADWYIYDVKNKTLKLITMKAGSVQDALSYNSKALKQFENTKKGKRLEPSEVISLIDNINTL